MQLYHALRNLEHFCYRFGCFTESHEMKHSELRRRKINALELFFRMINGIEIPASSSRRANHYFSPVRVG
jgi:hypothetical protein